MAGGYYLFLCLIFKLNGYICLTILRIVVEGIVVYFEMKMLIRVFLNIFDIEQRKNYVAFHRRIQNRLNIKFYIRCFFDFYEIARDRTFLLLFGT